MIKAKFKTNNANAMASIIIALERIIKDRKDLSKICSIPILGGEDEENIKENFKKGNEKEIENLETILIYARNFYTNNY